MFFNLLNNAVKHHDRDRGIVRVDWGDQFAFQERIFTVFQTLSGSSSPENTGIGLALIKKIVENEGGLLRLNSNGDRGCKFEFTWPKLL